jgi:prepilin signal peptidase PulO-like enzyme (type II secretory pathway)
LGLACIFGVATALVTRRREIRFGPHLAAGALAALGGAP